MKEGNKLFNSGVLLTTHLNKQYFNIGLLFGYLPLPTEIEKNIHKIRKK